MADAKYRVGQMVDLRATRPGAAGTLRGFKILLLLPYEFGERQYRIKTNTEAYERIAKESELSPAV